MAKRKQSPKPSNVESESLAVPEPTRTCLHCAYSFFDDGRFLINTMACWPTLLTCFNHIDHPGEIWQVGPDRTCRNFRCKRQPVVRNEPPAPPDDDTRYIALTKGKFALVAAADYERLNKYKWTASQVGVTWYARRQSRGKTIFMHREIMHAPDGMVVDHIDGNGLNDHPRNLRLCTHRQNAYNSRSASGTSKYKGVTYDKTTGKWRASINHNGKHYHLGLFDTEIEAAQAYDEKAGELFGQYAYLNFPEEDQAGDRRPQGTGIHDG